MNTTAAFFDKLDVLPISQQQVLLEFAEYLVRKYGKPDSDKKKKRKVGTLKGFLVYMADDFNAPLDDFKEYMQ
jgi:hypothetical protein